MKIVLVPQPVLYQKAKEVTQFDAKLKKIVSEMEALLDIQNDPPGVGLAAPQVGIPIQLFIVKENKKDLLLTCINPHILELKEMKPRKNQSIKKDQTQFEGCLSIPRIWGEIKRTPRIYLEYQTVTGETKKEWFQGFKSIIIQHEIDHLEGILFTQRVLEQGHQLYEEQEGELVKIKDLI